MAANMAGIHEGTLYGLQKLQDRSDRLNKERAAESRRKSEIAELKKTVKKLRAKKVKLQERLERGPQEILQDYLMQRETKTAAEISEEQREVVLEIAQSLQRRKLSDLCEAYRLVGISIDSQDANKTCFRCDTFFNCQYFKPYYIEVESGQKLKIHRHTVPYFIPLEKIAEDHLNSDIKTFFTTLTEYLNSFVARKEQVRLLEEQFGELLEGEVSCSPAFDFVQFTVKASEDPDHQITTSVQAKLMYEKLSESFPSKVNIQTTGKKATKRRFNKESKLFQELYIHKAFSEAFI